jgi:hypothetical protein
MWSDICSRQEREKNVLDVKTVDEKLETSPRILLVGFAQQTGMSATSAAFLSKQNNWFVSVMTQIMKLGQTDLHTAQRISTPTGRIFMKFDIWVFFRESVEKM